MIKQTVAQAIVLSRTNFQEADRILTLLTPQNGKLRLVAKGVRKSKSKMAGGIELFSISEIGFVMGKGELGTLTSSRLTKHFENIVADVERTMLGYELIKLINKATEDEPESDYFNLLAATFEALDDASLSLELVQLWFYSQLLQIAGHAPNLQTDSTGKDLDSEAKYAFDYDTMAFRASAQGSFGANDIKLLRLATTNSKPSSLGKVTNLNEFLSPNLRLLQSLAQQQIRS